MDSNTSSSEVTTETGSVLVVGGISIDLVTFSKRYPAPGETIIGDDFQILLGGKGSNQAIAAALAGSHSALVSCIGQDLFSDFATTTLKEFGVDTRFVRSVEGPTGIAHIRVEASGENTIVVVPLANSKLHKDQIDEAFAKNKDIKALLLQLEIAFELNQYAITQAKERGITIILDPAPASNLDESFWAQVDVVTPNESEASALTGIEVVDQKSAEQAGTWFIDHGVKNAVITMGGSGVIWVTKDHVQHFPAAPVQVIDTTAAGDAFAGYLGALISQGKDLESAIKLAVKAASLSVTKVGASPSLPTRAQVESF